MEFLASAIRLINDVTRPNHHYEINITHTKHSQFHYSSVQFIYCYAFGVMTYKTYLLSTGPSSLWLRIYHKITVVAPQTGSITGTFCFRLIWLAYFLSITFQWPNRFHYYWSKGYQQGWLHFKLWCMIYIYIHLNESMQKIRVSHSFPGTQFPNFSQTFS